MLFLSRLSKGFRNASKCRSQSYSRLRATATVSPRLELSVKPCLKQPPNATKVSFCCVHRAPAASVKGFTTSDERVILAVMLHFCLQAAHPLRPLDFCRGLTRRAAAR